jgi:hypothetical protein
VIERVQKSKEENGGDLKEKCINLLALAVKGCAGIAAREGVREAGQEGEGQKAGGGKGGGVREGEILT